MLKTAFIPLKNSLRTVHFSSKRALKPSLPYIIGIFPFVFTVFTRTLPCLFHLNLLPRSYLPMVSPPFLLDRLLLLFFAFSTLSLSFAFWAGFVPDGILHNCMLTWSTSSPKLDSQNSTSGRGPGHCLHREKGRIIKDKAQNCYQKYLWG